MSSVESFHLTRTPLCEGTTLLEASAGTGKTFTIAGLFLRLILERNLSVREILVVSFTEAATEQLRGRIRNTLSAATSAFSTGRTDETFLQGILANHQVNAKVMLARLERALRGFDEAPIYTIHGFCQRTLKDRAFESGALFDLELAPDQEKLFQEIADDFWRGQFYEGSLLRAAVALRNGLSPERFLPLLSAATRHPSLRFLSRTPGCTLKDISARLEQGVARAREIWREEGPEIRAHFGDRATWGKNPHNSDSQMAVLFERLETGLSEQPTPESLSALADFCSSALERSVTKRRGDAKAPKHRFFDLCSEILDLETDFLSALHMEFLDFARRELPRRKLESKLQSFDDLLTRLHEALAGEGGLKLAGEIRARYRAALIDEFQDTDPVQYQIFQRIFAPVDAKRTALDPEPETRNPEQPGLNLFPSAAADSLLFLIGDPKQAIYGFRGADIFTYLDAKREVDRRYTLDQNWRSESGLVQAVNTVFQFAEQPFVVKGIDFKPVEAKGEADRTPLEIDGRREAPLQLWFWPREEKEPFISTRKMAERLPAIVAAEIARLLNSNTRIGNQSLRPQDIAVLVMRNRQARLMQEALRALDIPSALHTDASLFNSPEATELCRVLAAIAQPDDDRLLRAALATDLFGVRGEEFDDFGRDEAAWQRHLERFHQYHELWRREGFMPMFRRWLREEEVRQRLLAFGDGERRLTNLLHLGEALHETALRRRFRTAGVVQWLAHQIDGDEKAAEEYQLRLERDDNAVKLVTIHKSKGLEYPVVFCPFAWRYSEINPLKQNRSAIDDEVCFHESDGVHRYVRDLGSRELETNKKRAMVENLAENVRLLYVALTRARHRCYFVWGGFNLAGTSAPAWLLHQPPCTATLLENVLSLQEAMKDHFLTLTDDAMLADVRRLETASRDKNGAPMIAVSPLPASEGEPYQSGGERGQSLEPLVFRGNIEREWRVASFSALAAGRRDESPDRDDAVAPVAPLLEEATGIFAFPAGAKAGTCLHEIFERLDFTETIGEPSRSIVEQRLRAHGFGTAAFTDSVCDALSRTLRVPLEEGRADFTLARVAVAERLSELEFYFPLKRLDPDGLREVFSKCAGTRTIPHNLERLEFSPVRGFMRGFIDLVFRFENRFYLVDWKSNWLGNRVEDYSQEAMRLEMAERFYTLQYHLYAVALHQYLKLRLPGYDYVQHFGGVRYLFVRGIDPARPEFGVFRERPDEELIRQLTEVLIDKPEMALV